MLPILAPTAVITAIAGEQLDQFAFVRQCLILATVVNAWPCIAVAVRCRPSTRRIDWCFRLRRDRHLHPAQAQFPSALNDATGNKPVCTHLPVH